MRRGARRRRVRRRDQHRRRLRHARHVPGPARRRLRTGDRERVEHARARAGLGLGRDRLPRRAGRPAPAHPHAGQRVGARRDPRRGAAAVAAGRGVRGDRAGADRARAGARRRAAAALAAARRAAGARPPARRPAAVDGRVRHRHLRRLLRRGAGDHPARPHRRSRSRRTCSGSTR